MHARHRHLLALTSLVILIFGSASYARARDSVSKFCSSDWFTSLRDQWASKKYEFHLLNKGIFIQGGSTYVLAAAFQSKSKTRTSDDVQFLVYRSPAGQEKFTLIYTERIEVLGEFSSEEDGCISTGAGLYFHVSIVDLEGNRNQRIVLESNSIGTCSSCLFMVRVYQVHQEKITRIVEETYNDVRFGPGQGLWLQSFQVDSEGRPVRYEKSFFMQNNPSKSFNK